MADPTPETLFTPIRAERYRAPERLGDLIAPPYDVLSEDAREAFARRSPYNIVHLTVPVGGADRYAAAAQVLHRWRTAGVLERDEGPALYVVQQEFATPAGRTHLRTGVIGGLLAEGYESGRVRPHERTHRGPKEDRLALGRATRTAVEPIFILTRDDRGHLQRRLDGVTHHEPMAAAELDGVRIGLWRITGVQAAELAHAVGNGPVYIADGHHRFETAAALRAVLPVADRIPALAVPVRDPGLVILATHRLVVGGPVDATALAAEWSGAFDVDETEAELDPHGLLDALGPHPAAVVAFPTGRLLVLRARDPHDGELETAVIERTVVQMLVAAAGSEATVRYTSNPGELLHAVAGGGSAGVLIRPTPIERVLTIADAGGIMPPKSTYFAPKVPSGLLILPFDEVAGGGTT
ncbi:MAG: DUF1015 domain-containing protein [Gemmatimonadota bacterium]|nr:DUF1015 domain-containing protein [Gemmatimonadota bacterium]MDH5195750.1 DUF1015 domain-containing protein [Gemmatimonadota bacterium]